ncbi:DNA/RNA helicase [Lacticaseibacillus paracasei]|uniref:Eco57I restriction-modification methylase domain-containing protein n=1 Tax=Lacticaseibacillus paracasei TaxID=1597 RepID=UPI0003433A4F|nr:Eco57I restriction-modification methylase domain-containing protein [Lacticaseibacillus paracasei]EPC39048.1 type II restriction endonuclease [Lacticaseibacillus paracasei subsp. paracasei Lpp229]MCT3319290.1 DNA/RNA helicase [Lacticaseibacillus paracasei]
MKFDVVVGNPPFMESGESRDEPMYQYFYDLATKVAPKYCLISPGRFLFNAGQTSKAWNKKMLTDPHLKVLFYDPNAAHVFQGQEIKGGVAVLYRDINVNDLPIGTFTHYPELTAIARKVAAKTTQSFADFVQPQGIYRFTHEFFEDFPQAEGMQGKGTKNKIVSKSFAEMDFAFREHSDGNDYVKMWGFIKGNRIVKWIDLKYLKTPDSFNKWKVIVAEANGSGQLGEPLSMPFILQPGVGHTDTFLTIGGFETESEAEHVLKYVKSKFSRVLLGIKKITQHNSRHTWSNIPAINFKNSSQVDWNKPMSDIDRQLYSMYGLDDAEIQFIESHVKAMN